VNNYLIEKRLSDTAPDLHQRVRSSFFALQRMLDSYLSWFPDFTDHSLLHSMDVLDYCNRLLGDQVRELTPLECYVLIMSCYLHDAGMGVSAKDFETFSKELDLSGYRKKNPLADIPQTIRSLHHELSGRFIHRTLTCLIFPTRRCSLPSFRSAEGIGRQICLTRRNIRIWGPVRA